MLALHRYRLRLSTALEAPRELPLSVVRSAWGAALRRLACSTGAATCNDCGLSSSCAYRKVFDPVSPSGLPLGPLSAVPPAYVLGGIVQESRQWSLECTLFGPGQRELGLVLAAMDQAMQTGLGKSRIPFRTQGVESLQAGSWRPLDPGQPPAPSLLLEHSPNPRSSVGCPRAVQIELLSPLRLQSQGKVVHVRDLTPRAWLMALARRLGLLADLYGSSLGLDFQALSALAAQTRMPESALRWVDDARWSSRQQQAHPMGGLLGRFTIEGPIAPFLALLPAGEWLHVGKHAAYGQGRFRVLAVTEA